MWCHFTQVDSDQASSPLGSLVLETGLVLFPSMALTACNWNHVSPPALAMSSMEMLEKALTTMLILVQAHLREVSI